MITLPRLAVSPQPAGGKCVANKIISLSRPTVLCALSLSYS